jgi:hypothetical protein
MNHRGTETQRIEEEKANTAKEARNPGIENDVFSLFLVSWLP